MAPDSADWTFERTIPSDLGVGHQVLADLLARFRRLDADTPVIYYSRGTGPAWWDHLAGLPFQCLGVDWRHDIGDVLQRYGERWAIQGNVDPEWLHLPGAELETRLRDYFGRVRALPAELRRGWICGGTRRSISDSFRIPASRTTTAVISHSVPTASSTSGSVTVAAAMTTTATHRTPTRCWARCCA